MARYGEVEALMKGSQHTDELMAGGGPTPHGLRTARRASHVFVMDVPAYPRMLFITDAAVNIAPTLDGQGRHRAATQSTSAHVLGVARAEGRDPVGRRDR